MKLQYKDLKVAADFLKKISLKGKKSVHRMRIVKVLEEQNKKFAEEELELLKSYAELDEQGELVPTQGGGFKIKEDKDKKEFRKQQEELYQEYFVVDDKNLETALKTVEEVVNDYNKELSDKDAEAHFLLVEAFENKEGDE
ncbi:hypothetical protein [Bacillus sp. JCM 19034]|uniref:hypothetical protein n=1 Tax=Bacillus sp. JCM 19034 TaxID=1481928 RepID=UPI0007858563|nr:hypothetical protein [Bacillus sp. JCM 19034]